MELIVYLDSIFCDAKCCLLDAWFLCYFNI